MYAPNLCAKYQEKIGKDVKVDLYSSGCPFEVAKTGLYKMWRIPLTLKTEPLALETRLPSNDPQVHYSGKWVSTVCSKNAGDFSEFGFERTGVTLFCEKGAFMGTIEVFLDEKSQGTINLKVADFPNLARIPVFRSEGVAPGRHLLRVVNQGGGPIFLNGFSVTPATAK